MDSKTTSIDNLASNKEISKEDLDLVDSILNDLNKGQPEKTVEQSGQPQIQRVQPQMQRGEILERQKILERQQNNTQRSMEEMATINSVNRSTLDNIIDMVKYESRNILLVIVLSFISNLEQSNSLLRYYSGAFIENTGVLTMQGMLIKSLVIGLIYFIIKSQFL